MLSIITINYNKDASLKLTLASLQKQIGNCKFEHIIIDGASTDNSVKIAEEYKLSSQNVILKSENDLGIYNAMNKGIKVATGSHIAFLNSGDILGHNQVLKDICSAITSNNSLDFLYGDLCFVDKKGIVFRKWDSGAFNRSKLYFGWMPPHPMTTIRASLLRSSGNFDENFRISADYDLMLNILLQPGIEVKYLPKKFVHMELGGVSNGSLIGILHANTEVLKSWIKHKGFLSPYWVFLLKPLKKIFQIRKW